MISQRHKEDSKRRLFFPDEAGRNGVLTMAASVKAAPAGGLLRAGQGAMTVQAGTTAR